jgi:hypothetical protein
VNFSSLLLVKGFDFHNRGFFFLHEHGYSLRKEIEESESKESISCGQISGFIWRVLHLFSDLDVVKGILISQKTLFRYFENYPFP